jgi:hypothetical protein
MAPMITVHHSSVSLPSSLIGATYFTATSRAGSHEQSQTTLERWRMIMKTIASLILAVSVIAGIAAPASAFDASKFWQQYDLTHSNG